MGVSEEKFKEEKNKLRKIRSEKQQVRKECISEAREDIRKALNTLEYKIAGRIDGEYDRDIELLKKRWGRR